MSVLAHVFEAAGLATVVLASMRPVVEKMEPPRALYCDFPLGRPLGKPGDSAFQANVLTAAFALLEAPTGPALTDYPEAIVSDEQPVSCQLPPTFDPDELPAIAEANAIRKAYERTLQNRGVSSVGRVLGVDQLDAGLRALDQLASGEHWRSVDIPGKSTTGIVHDIRTYYEEAALSLVDAPNPAGRALEGWFFDQTEAGKLVLAARSAIRDQDAPMPVWFYMAPAHR